MEATEAAVTRQTDQLKSLEQFGYWTVQRSKGKGVWLRLRVHGTENRRKKA